MKNRYRIIELYKSYFKVISLNSFKLWLTIIGVSIGMTLMIITTILISSYENSFYSKYESYGDKIIYLNNKEGFLLEDITFLDSKLSNDIITYSTSVFSFNEKGIMINNCINVRGISSNFINNYVIDVNLNNGISSPQIYEIDLLYGSYWTIDDYQFSSKKIIINDYGAKCYFGNNNPIGKKVKINNENFEVVGVVNNSESTTSQINYLNQADIDKIDNENLCNFVEIFMPITTYKKYIDNNCSIKHAIIKLNDSEKNEQITENLKYYFKNKSEINVTNRNDIYLEIYGNMRNLKFLFNLVLVFFIILSIFIISNTLFYGLKEKINEIGIRKALGATDDDIISQIVFEGIFYIIISFLLALCISLVVIIIFFIFIENNPIALYIKLHIDVLMLVYLLILFLLVGILASMIPGILAVKMKIIDILKFDS